MAQTQLLNPKLKVIRRADRIAVPRVARKQKECGHCLQMIVVTETYYSVVLNGGGLEWRIHPTVLHEFCLEAYMRDREREIEQAQALWVTNRKGQWCKYPPALWCQEGAGCSGCARAEAKGARRG